MFVTHGADLHAPLPLSVPLGEELLHDAVRPLPVQLERLSGVTQICTVHHVLQNLDITNTRLKEGEHASHMLHDLEQRGTQGLSQSINNRDSCNPVQ